VIKPKIKKIIDMNTMPVLNELLCCWVIEEILVKFNNSENVL